MRVQFVHLLMPYAFSFITSLSRFAVTMFRCRSDVQVSDVKIRSKAPTVNEVFKSVAPKMRRKIWHLMTTCGNDFWSDRAG